MNASIGVIYSQQIERLIVMVDGNGKVYDEINWITGITPIDFETTVVEVRLLDHSNRFYSVNIPQDYRIRITFAGVHSYFQIGHVPRE